MFLEPSPPGRRSKVRFARSCLEVNHASRGGQARCEGGHDPLASFANSASRYLAQAQRLEEIIALVVDDDEGRKILHLDAPDRLHAELRVLEHLDLLDAALGQVRGR